jgi:hypothetical protein
MSSLTRDESYLAWLMAGLVGKRDRIVDLLRRLSGLGRAAHKPKLFRKFLNMLDEVALAKREETSLISRIEAIEQKHRFLRQSKSLRQFGVKAAAPLPVLFPKYPEPKPRGPSKLWLLVLWYYLLRSKNNQKKQGLSYD